MKRILLLAMLWPVLAADTEPSLQTVREQIGRGYRSGEAMDGVTRLAASARTMRPFVAGVAWGARAVGIKVPKLGPARTIRAVR